MGTPAGRLAAAARKAQEEAIITTTINNPGAVARSLAADPDLIFGLRREVVEDVVRILAENGQDELLRAAASSRRCPKWARTSIVARLLK